MRPISSTFVRVIPAALLLLAITAVPALARPLDVEIWTDRGNDAVYEPGDAMRVKVRTTEDAYLLVYEIDSDGNVNLLYPWRRGTGRVDGRETLRLPEDNSDYQLVVERATGQGFLVAVASDRPFRDLPWYLRPFDPQAASVGYEGEPDAKDEEGFDDKGRVVGDPYVAMERIRRRVLDDPAQAQGFATSYATYYVHEQVRYPRYLCNDCHRPAYWAWWDGFDPYYAHCSVVDFRVNWSWAWGPRLWTTYMPYYYYTVRADCPPRYRSLFASHTRFSSWDGWGRWNGMWGGQLHRYKPAAAPVGYAPPPPRGTAWRQGQTPPGFVPPDVRRQTNSPGTRPQGWMPRDRGDGTPVWRPAARPAPDPGGGDRGRPTWLDGRGRGADRPGQQDQGERRTPQWNPGSPHRDAGPQYTPPRGDAPRRDGSSPRWRQPAPDSRRGSAPPKSKEGRGGDGKTKG